jgi:hypothetical protein
MTTPDDDYLVKWRAFYGDTDFQDLLSKIQAATPAQVKTYVANNVTDLASARLLLTKILLLLTVK